MSKQIAVRLPDYVVEYIDQRVARGRDRSRAAVVTRALERERRRDRAVRDAELLAQEGCDPDLTALAAHTAASFPSLD